jgi:hypothetical protein
LREKRDYLYNSLLPSGIRYDKDTVQTSPDDTMPEKVESMLELDEKLRDMIHDLERRELMALSVIQKIPESEHRQVLILYYLTMRDDNSLLSWEDVATKICKEVRQTQRIHELSLKEFAKLSKNVIG